MSKASKVLEALTDRQQKIVDDILKGLDPENKKAQKIQDDIKKALLRIETLAAGIRKDVVASKFSKVMQDTKVLASLSKQIADLFDKR